MHGEQAVDTCTNHLILTFYTAEMDNKAIDYILSLLYFVCHNCRMLSLAYSYDGLWRPILLYARKSEIPAHCFHHCETSRNTIHVRGSQLG